MMIHFRKQYPLYLFFLLISLHFIGYAQSINPIHEGSIVNGEGRESGEALLQGPRAVFVSGNYAYVASTFNSALEIVDISNPSLPRHTGSITNGEGGATLNIPRGIFVSGSFAYVASAGSNALEIVDVSNPASPVHRGSIVDGAGGASLKYPMSVFVVGSNAYVASAKSNTMEVIDVSNPAAPFHKGSISDGVGGANLFYPNCVYVSGSYAYLASEASNAVEIVDISNPSNPVHKGSYMDPTGNILSDVISIFVSGHYAYIANSSGNSITILDVSNPASPILAGSLFDGTGGALLNSPFSIQVSGHLAFVASSGNNAVEIVDVTNPAAPFHKSSIANGANGAKLNNPNSLVVSGNHVYVASANSDALEIISISNPGSPIHSGSIADNGGGALLRGAASVVVSGNYAYVSGRSNALEIVDVSNPAVPIHKGNITNGNGISLNTPLSLAVSGNFAYTASAGNSAVEVVDISDPTGPLHAGFIHHGTNGANLFSPSSIYVSGSHAYVTSYQFSALEILDISDPYNPNHAGTILDGVGGAKMNTPEKVFVTGGLAYVVSSGSNALEIIDVNNPTTPVHKGNITDGTGGAMLNTPVDVFVKNNYAFITSPGSLALEIIDVSNPLNPIHAASLVDGSGGATLEGCNSIKILNNYAFVTVLDGLEIIDISNPLVPTHKAIIKNGSNGALLSGPTCVFVTSNFAYVSSGNSSALEIIALFAPASPVATAGTTISQNSFVANWNLSANASYYAVEVSDQSGFGNIVSSSTVPGGNANAATVQGLAAGTRFYYRVRAGNASTGLSLPSNAISVLTIPPTPITGPADPGPTTTSFIAKWDSARSAVNYKISVATDPTFGSHTLHGYDNFSVGKVFSYEIKGLASGIKYYFQISALNASGQSPFSNSTSTTTLPSFTFPYNITMPTGGKESDYIIISIPQGTQASSGLAASSYGQNWRVMHWEDNKNADLKDIALINPATGYWVNSNLNPAPTITVKGSVLQKDATLNLLPGWNQVGNPLAFDLSWSDILQQNNNLPGIGNIDSLYLFNIPADANKGFKINDGLRAFGGGFVNNKNTFNVQLTVPTSTRIYKGARKANGSRISSDLSGREWFIPLTLQVGSEVKTEGGIGMRPDASTGIDHYDGIALPHVFTYADLSSSHPEFFQPQFSRDVVPSRDRHAWTFSVSSNSEEHQAGLSWDNKALGTNLASLILYDQTTATILNMKNNSQYPFDMNGGHTIKFFYSADGTLSPDITAMGIAYPNPFSSQITFPFLTSGEHETIRIALFNLTGQPVRTLVNAVMEPGYHEAIWEGSDDQGARVPTGMYLFKFSSSASSVPKVGKIILR